MRRLRAFLLRLASVFQGPRGESQVAAELESHLEMHIEDNLRAGMTPEEARRQALIKLGGLEQIRRACTDRRGLPLLDNLLQDLRFAARMLRKSPGTTVVAILTLALGIGGNSAIFSLVNSVVLRPLPYRQAGRLMWVSDRMAREHASIVTEVDYFGLRSENRVFEDLAAYEAGETMTLSGMGEPRRIHAGRGTYNLLEVLGVAPRLGRNFREEEDRPGAGGVVLLSDSFWRHECSANPNAIGRNITLDNDVFTIVGVLPEDFEFLDNTRADVVVPSLLENHDLSAQKGVRIVGVVGRLKAGITPDAAAAHLDSVNQRLWAAYPAPFARMLEGARAQVVPLHERLVGNVRPALLVLLVAVGLVLLIACANVANLQLARGIAREKEMAVRSALGAGRSRLAVQLFTENIAIAAAGGLGGIWVARWLVAALARFGPGNTPHLSLAHLDSRALLFTMAISLLTGVLFGLAPARAAARVPLAPALKESGTHAGTSVRLRRPHQLLLVAQLGMALVLLCGAGLLVRSFLELASIPAGFDGRGVLTARISLPPNIYQTPDQQAAFIRKLGERLGALPGAQSTGLTTILPLESFNNSASIDIEGLPPAAPGAPRPLAGMAGVTPGYFDALRISLVAGRFLDREDEHSNRVVVNQAFARKYFAGVDPLGKRVRAGSEEAWWTVVGVSGDSKQAGLAAAVEPEMFLPLEKWSGPEMSLLVRVPEGNPLRLVPSLRAIVAELDGNLPLYGAQALSERLSDGVASERFNAGLLGAFAGFAVLLSAIGAYGVMAFAVGQRTHEIGVRMALGASPRQVFRMILGEGIVLGLAGLVVGLLGSLALTRFLKTLLYGVGPTDPWTFAGVTLLLLAIVLAACWLPARRAIRVDPMAALRYE